MCKAGERSSAMLSTMWLLGTAAGGGGPSAHTLSGQLRASSVRCCRSPAV